MERPGKSSAFGGIFYSLLPSIMVDQITRTVRQGFFSRLANSFVGILFGLLLVPGSVLLIGWNEYRTVHRSRGLAEAEGAVTGVADPFEISQTQNDKLVHVIGTATTEEKLSDAEFGISQTVLRLERKVEMYQWVEHKEKKTRDKIGGGRETITTYSYEKNGMMIELIASVLKNEAITRTHRCDTCPNPW
jgi:hypothetical protein